MTGSLSQYICPWTLLSNVTCSENGFCPRLRISTKATVHGQIKLAFKVVSAWACVPLPHRSPSPPALILLGRRADDAMAETAVIVRTSHAEVKIQANEAEL